MVTISVSFAKFNSRIAEAEVTYGSSWTCNFSAQILALCDPLANVGRLGPEHRLGLQVGLCISLEDCWGLDANIPLSREETTA